MKTQNITFILSTFLIWASLLVADIPGDWSSASTYSSGDLVIHSGVTYQAQQSVPANTTPGTNTAYWQSLDDLSGSQVDPGSPPDASPDPDEVTDLSDPGTPESGNSVADLGDSWLKSDWFGVYRKTDTAWFFHAKMGWIYLVDGDSGILWFWHPDLGWLGTKSDVFPRIYSASHGNWIFLSPDSANGRYFYDFSTQAWGLLSKTTVPQLNGGVPSDWSSITAYSEGAIVIHSSSTYQALQDVSVGVTPGTDAAFWKSLDETATNFANPGTPPEEVPDVSEVSALIVPNLPSSGTSTGVPSDWSSATTYSSGDLAIYNGSTYLAQQNTSGVIPGSNANHWKSLDDMANSISSPGSPPDDTPDASEVDNLTNPGAPDADTGVLDRGASWRESDWFGLYHKSGSDALYHSIFGWIKVRDAGSGGVWIFRLSDGVWLFTNREVFPHVYKAGSQNWEISSNNAIGGGLPGDWSSASTYAEDALVIYNGSSYQAQRNVPANIVPGTNNSYWKSLEDSASGQVDPGDPPTTSPDVSEVASLDDPGSPDGGHGGGVTGGVPSLINFRGKLQDALGQPVNGSVKAGVRIFDSASGGSVIYYENIGQVAVQQGLYSFRFGHRGSPDFGWALTHHDEAWLEIVLDGEAMSPRERLVAVPFALTAREAQTVSDGAITAEKLSPSVRASLNGTVASGGGAPAVDSITLEMLSPGVRASLASALSGGGVNSATLLNPYGILGIPVTVTADSYTVPAGKVLVMQSLGGEVYVKVGNAKIASSGYKSIIPGGTSITLITEFTGAAAVDVGFTGFLYDNRDDLTPVIVSSGTYTVPAGKYLVITSQGSRLKVNNRLIGGEPAIISAGEAVTTEPWPDDTSGLSTGFTGYLKDL